MSEATHKVVVSPLAATIVSVDVEAGTTVEAGQPLLVLESMKMQTTISAPADATVLRVCVEANQTIQKDSPLFELSSSATPTRDTAQATATLSQANVQNTKDTFEQFRHRINQTSDNLRREARDKRHAQGFRSARENLVDLCDNDSFMEYGQFAVAAQRGRRDYEELKTATAADGVITGIGTINAEVLPEANCRTAIAINDYSVLAGTQGYYHHHKLDRILETAEAQKLPVVMYTEGGGGRPGDTDITTVNSGLSCRSFATWSRLSGRVPRISVANGYCFAGNAALFGAADITIATRQSYIGMAGPAMIEGGGLGSFKPTEIGPIEIQSQNGVVDIVAENEAEATGLAKKCLSYFQGNKPNWRCADQGQLRNVLPEDRRFVYEVRQVIDILADTDSVQELKPRYGGAIIIALIRIEGRPVGVVASDCKVLGGAIDVAAGEKAAQFINLCDSFGIPLLSLCDTPGFMVGPDHEALGAVRRLSSLFAAGAQVSVPLIAIVLRKCYGLGAQALLGGSTANPNYTVAWPTGEFGGMGLEGAVRLGFKKELEAETDPEARQTLFEKLLAEQYRRGQASEVASILEIDAVIDPADSRKTIVALLSQPNYPQ